MNERRDPLRVRSISLRDFKGFWSDDDVLEIDLDADVVLLVGANGRGKTSVIEALELALTGVIQQRVGDPSDYKLRDFVHHFPGASGNPSESLVHVTWDSSKGNVHDDVTIKDHKPKEGDQVEREGWWERACNSDQRLARLVSTGQLRANTFLYAESLGSMLGLDRKTRGLALDMFLPPFARAQTLAGPEQFSLVEKLDDLDRRTRDHLVDLRALEADELRAAKAVVTAWSKIDKVKPLSLLKRDGTFYANWDRKLIVAAQEVGLDSVDSVDADNLTVLAASADARAKSENDAESAEAERRSAVAAAWVALKQAIGRLRAAGYSSFPDLRTIDARLASLPAHENVEAEKGTLGTEREGLVRARSEVWSIEDIEDAVGEAARAPLGTLPLLLSIRHLQTTHSQALSRMGLEALASTETATLMADERRSYSDATKAISDLDARLQELKESSDTRNRLATLRELVEAVEAAWGGAAAGRPLPASESGEIDIAAVDTEIADNIGYTAPHARGAGGQGWRDLASAFSTWSEKLGVLEKARALREHQKNWVHAHDVVEEVRTELGHLDRLDKALRRELIHCEIEEPLNRALQRVLRGYAHRSNLVDHARISFDNSNILRVQVGDGSKAPGLVSLSRSQYTSLTVAMAIVAHLGLPDPPVGFVCLDDVSDALDVDNLAADAMLFRLLAYGDGPSRRQLILTNHNDQLTDRLVPLLLPPRGRTMRIVELKEKAGGRGFWVKQWRVQSEAARTPPAGRSRLMDVLVPIADDRVSSD